MGEEHHIAPSTAYRRCVKVLDNLPHCADITRKYCTKFCGILVVDGKYVEIKGYERKIPVIYGIDYLTHDIPTYILSKAENYPTCKAFFSSLRLLNYPLSAIVSDDNINIYSACSAIYPQAITQLCHNHYKESLRQALEVRTDPTYVEFMRQIEELFLGRRAKDEFNRLAAKIYAQYKSDPRLASVMIDIQRRLPMLTGYMAHDHIPRTTNLIESFNSHLEGRLKTIKGFESFKHADSWLNAYFLRRRIKPFTDCTKQFSRLNGTCSLLHTMKDSDKLTDVLKLFR